MTTHGSWDKSKLGTTTPSRPRLYSQYMAIRSVSFDDPSDEGLAVFSGHDLMLSHCDYVDLDWQEVAERTAIDERRGLVVLQVAALEDLVNQIILYLAAPSDQEEMRLKLSRQTLGPRIDRLEGLLREAGLFDDEAAERIADLRRVTERRNELAHGTIPSAARSRSSPTTGRT